MPALRVWGILDVFVLTSIVLLAARSESVAQLRETEERERQTVTTLERTRGTLADERRQRGLTDLELESERRERDALAKAVADERRDREAERETLTREIARLTLELEQHKLAASRQTDGRLDEVLQLLRESQADQLREMAEALELSRAKQAEAERQSASADNAARAATARAEEAAREMAALRDRMETLRESNRLLREANAEAFKTPQAASEFRELRAMVDVVEVVLAGDSVVRIGSTDMAVGRAIEAVPLHGEFQGLSRFDERVGTELAEDVVRLVRNSGKEQTLIHLTYRSDSGGKEAPKVVRDQFKQLLAAKMREAFPAGSGRRVAVSEWSPREGDGQ